MERYDKAPQHGSQNCLLLAMLPYDDATENIFIHSHIIKCCFVVNISSPSATSGLLYFCTRDVRYSHFKSRLLLTIERKLAGILIYKFNHHGDYTKIAKLCSTS